MIKKERTEASKASNDTMKAWFDLMSTWTQPALEGVRGYYNPSGEGNKDLAEWWNINADWEEASENWTRMLKGGSAKTGGLEDMSEFFLKHVAALHKFQDEWSDTWIQLSRTAYEIGVESGMDDGIDVDRFFDTLNSAGVRLERVLEDYLKDSSYPELAPVLSAGKTSMDAFSEEKKVATAVCKEWIITQRKIAKLCKTAVEEWGSALENMREDGKLPTTAVRQILVEYGVLMKKITKKLDIPDEIKDHFETRMDDGIHLNNRGLDSVLSWMEMTRKFNRAFFESTRKLFRFSNAHKLLTEGNVYQEGRNQYETFIREIIRNSEISEGMPEWIAATAEFSKLWQAFSMNCLMPACLPVFQPKPTETSDKKQYAAKTPGKIDPDQVPADKILADPFPQSNV